MKVIIAKKRIKEGEKNGRPYCIKSLFVKTKDESIFNKIIAQLKLKGADQEKIDKFISRNEWNGEASYPFNLSCSGYTFEKVKKFDELDAKIEFGVNEQGWCFAKIAVIDKKEQVIGCISSGYVEEEVEGWENEPEPTYKTQVSAPPPLPVDDLPF